MRYPNWVVYVLKHVPFIRVQESRPLTSGELKSVLDRIMLEKEVQWKFNHPNDPFPGVAGDVIKKELLERLVGGNEQH